MNDYAEENTLDVTNPAPRCPVILLLDTSGSMSGEPISELEEGLKQFLRETSDSVADQDKIQLGNVTSWADLAGTPASSEE